MTRFTVILISFLCFSSVIHASSDTKALLQDAHEYRFGINGRTRDLEKSIKLLEEIINTEVPKDSNEQQEHLEKAFLYLGQIYEFGEDPVKSNFELAIKYYNRSAEFGNADAQQSLAFLWGTGKGVPINKPLSLLYYAFSAQGGNTAAELALGNKYMFGHNVQRSCEKAIQKYELVASKVVRELKESRLSGMGHHGDSARLSEVFEASKDKYNEEGDVVKYYQYSADTGDATAQVTMGTLNLQGGYGVERNLEAAFSYFQRAADQGDAGGISNLGFMYAQGYGTTQNNETAVKLYEEAAGMGNALAQTNLGYMLMHGYGITKNLPEALQYFKLAADQGHPEGLLNLGNLYYNGEGVKQDYAKALAHFSSAAQQGNLIALFNLAQMYHLGLGVPPSCSTAVQWYKKVAERGQWSKTLDEAYDLYQEGDYDDSLLQYERAAEQGYEIAQSNAGWLYDKGLGPMSSSSQSRYQLAFEYYRNSADQKNPLSYLKIGDYYFYGRGTSVNLEKAAAYYQAASYMKNAQATFNLGYMHENGLGLPRDLHLAKRQYDMVLEMDSEAVLAVYLALAKVGIQYVWENNLDWKSYSPSTIMNRDTILLLCLTFVLFVLLAVKRILLRQRPAPAPLEQ